MPKGNIMKDLLKSKFQPSMQTLGPQFKFALREDLKDNKEFLPSRAEPLASGWDVKAAWNENDVDYNIITQDANIGFDYKLHQVFDSKSSGIKYLCEKEVPSVKSKKIKGILGKPKIVSAYIPAGEYIKIPTGFKILAPEGWWVELKPRSSTFAKKFCHSLYGTIDNGFYNELLFAIQYLPEENLYDHNHNLELITKDDYYGNTTQELTQTPLEKQYLKIDQGEAIAQIIPVRLQNMEVLEISNEEFDAQTTLQKEKIKAQFGNVRDGGIGSTDKK
jgi:dUTPase